METSISLLQEVKGGCEDAWTELTRLYQPLVSRWLRSYHLRPDDADDLTQEVLITLLRHVREFDHNGRVGAFRNFLRTITRSRASDFLRRSRNKEIPQGGSSFHEMVRELENPESQTSRRFDHEHDVHLLSVLLQRVRGEFKPSSMEIFQAHLVSGRSAANVATEFGVTRHAVYMAKSRVLRRLRELAPTLIEDMEEGGSC